MISTDRSDRFSQDEAELELCFDIVIQDRAVVAVTPKPELLPYCEATTERFEVDFNSKAFQRKRRILYTLAPDYGYHFLSPELREILLTPGDSIAGVPHGNLSPDGIGLIRKLSKQGATLREIATAVDAWHATVRNYYVTR